MHKDAVVMGGSISGLLCAVVLSPHFDKVTIIERDGILEPGNSRKGVAQSPHTHILLKRGLIGFETLLPGFIDDLKNAGAISTNATQEWQSLFPKGFMSRFMSDIDVLCQSRTLLERTLREHVIKKLKNLHVIQKANILNYRVSVSENPVVSYTINQNTLELKADLLVDCTGRNTKTPGILEKYGIGKVSKSMVCPYLGYSSRVYRNVKLPDNYISTLIMADAPNDACGGVITPIEDNQHIVTLFGFSKNYPPGKDVDFLEFAKNLRAETIYNALKGAEPVSEIKQFVKNESQFYHYDNTRNWPKGFMVMGDAITSFNPIYGQGITTAIIAAENLHKLINKQSQLDQRSCKKIQKKLCQSYALPWMISKNEDLRWPKTTGDKAGTMLRLMHKYSDMVARAGTRSTDITYAYYSVLHMTHNPTILMRPDIFAKVIMYGRKQSEPTVTINSEKPASEKCQTD